MAHPAHRRRMGVVLSTAAVGCCRPSPAFLLMTAFRRLLSRSACRRLPVTRGPRTGNTCSGIWADRVPHRRTLAWATCRSGRGTRPANGHPVSSAWQQPRPLRALRVLVASPFAHRHFRRPSASRPPFAVMFAIVSLERESSVKRPRPTVGSVPGNSSAPPWAPPSPGFLIDAIGPIGGFYTAIGFAALGVRGRKRLPQLAPPDLRGRDASPRAPRHRTGASDQLDVAGKELDRAEPTCGVSERDHLCVRPRAPLLPTTGVSDDLLPDWTAGWRGDGLPE